MNDSVQLARIEERVKTMDGNVTRLCRLLEGDGSDGVPGLLKDVDRLKQTEKRRKWVSGFILTGFITLIGERVSAFFK